MSYPVLVIQALFKHSVMDLSWSLDGTRLACCSYDGTVRILEWEDGELGIPQTDTGADFSNYIPKLSSLETASRFPFKPPPKLTTAALRPSIEKNITSPPLRVNGSTSTTTLSKQRRIQPTLLESYDDVIEDNNTDGHNAHCSLFSKEPKEQVTLPLPIFRPFLECDSSYFVDQKNPSTVELMGPDGFHFPLPESISIALKTTSCFFLSAANNPYLYIYDHSGIS